MKKMYAVHDKNIYELTDIPRNGYLTIDNETETGVKIQTNEKSSEVDVNLNLGLINEDYKTNEEVVKDALEYAKAMRLKKCWKLDSNFTISLAYTLVERKSNKVVDEGVLIRHNNEPDLHNKFRILGVTEDNNLHYRVVKNLTSYFTLTYQDDVPCGIMAPRNHQYVLNIENIKIEQNVVEDGDYRKYEERMCNHHPCSEGIVVPHDANHYHEKSNDKICIFNSKFEGVKINPIIIDMKLRRITINLSMILNNYFILYDDKVLNKIFMDNIDYKPEKDQSNDCTCGCFSDNYEYIDPLGREFSEPELLTYKNHKCFFANGTPIAITKRLDNVKGATIHWGNNEVNIDDDTIIFGGRHDDDTLTNTNINICGGYIHSVYGGGLHKSHVSCAYIDVKDAEIKNLCGGGALGIIDDCGCTNIAFDGTDLKDSPCVVDKVNITFNGGKVDLFYGGGVGLSYTKIVKIEVNGDSQINYLTSGGSNGLTSNAQILVGKRSVKPGYQPNINILQGINRGQIDNINIDINAGTIDKLFAGGEIPFVGTKENPDSKDAYGTFKHSTVEVNANYADIKSYSLGGNDYEEIPEENDLVTYIKY